MKFINKNAYILVSEALQKLSNNYVARRAQDFLKKFPRFIEAHGIYQGSHSTWKLEK